jgi:hypothetical protein
MDESHRREDAICFYAIASASLLESAVPEYVANLLALFQDDADVEAWLGAQWYREELEHGRLLQGYVRRIWPEFAWRSAFAEYQERIPKGTGHLQSSRALEALARCVTETHAAMMYRCLATAYAQDQALSGLLLQLNRDEVHHYRRFRRIFESYEGVYPESPWRKARTILSRSGLARGRDVEIAFFCLNRFWESGPPFLPLSYGEFLERGRRLARTYLDFESTLRMLLRPLGTGSLALRAARWLLDRRLRAVVNT